MVSTRACLLIMFSCNSDAQARRYDSRTTTFSPEGRLYQVEYAMTAIGHAGICIGVLATDGVLLGVEKKIASKLLEVTTSEKMYKVGTVVTALQPSRVTLSPRFSLSRFLCFIHYTFLLLTFITSRLLITLAVRWPVSPPTPTSSSTKRASTLSATSSSSTSPTPCLSFNNPFPLFFTSLLPLLLCVSYLL